MNRTMLSVIALAVGAVLIIGLYNIYKPKVNKMSHDVFDKIHVSRMGPKQYKYQSLYYTDDHHGNIEFTHGTVNTDSWYGRDSLNNFNALTSGPAPHDLKTAKTIKFDDTVDFSHARNLNGMFANSADDGMPSRLESVDFGDNFDVSHVHDYTAMFIWDNHLKHINFGHGFKMNPNSYTYHMFMGSKPTELSGNVPQQIKDAIKVGNQ